MKMLYGAKNIFFGNGMKGFSWFDIYFEDSGNG